MIEAAQKKITSANIGMQLTREQQRSFSKRNQSIINAFLSQPSNPKSKKSWTPVLKVWIRDLKLWHLFGFEVHSRSGYNVLFYAFPVFIKMFTFCRYSSRWDAAFTWLTPAEAVLMLLWFKILFMLNFDEKSECIKQRLIDLFNRQRVLFLIQNTSALGFVSSNVNLS